MQTTKWRGWRAALIGGVVTCALGCVAPTESEEDEESALTHEEMAKKFEGAKRLATGVPVSARQARKLGIVSWSAYYAARKDFIGVVMLAEDAKKDVKFAILVNAARAADGKRRMTIFSVDQAGLETKSEDASIRHALSADIPRIQSEIQRNDEANESATALCVRGVGAVTIAAVGATAGLWLMAVPSVAASAAGSGATVLVDALAMVPGASVFAGHTGLAIGLDAAGYWSTVQDRIERCSEVGNGN